MSTTSERKIKVAFIFLAAAQMVVGLNVTLAKYIIENMPAYLYLGLRFWITAIILGFISWIFKKPFLGDDSDGKLTKRLLVLLTLQGFTGSFLFNLIIGWGLPLTTATSAGIVCSTLPAFIAVLSWLILKEKINSMVKYSIVLATVGLVILNLDNVSLNSSDLSMGSLLGDLLVLIAIIPEALYSIIGKFVGKSINVLVGAFWVNFTTAILFTPIMLYSVLTEPVISVSPMVAGGVVLSALFSVIFFSSWMKGLNEVPASKAGIFGSLMPVMAALSGIVFLGENLNIYNGIGMLFVLVSIWIGTLKGKREDLKSLSNPIARVT